MGFWQRRRIEALLYQPKPKPKPKPTARQAVEGRARPREARPTRPVCPESGSRGAARLLAIADVAERVGYGSASTFSTAFSRYVGVPPGRYVKAREAMAVGG